MLGVRGMRFSEILVRGELGEGETRGHLSHDLTVICPNGARYTSRATAWMTL
jgi:hypothetical protein